MSCRIKIPVSMELLSDAIPGSGESVPGGVDIAVYTDRDGYPYFKATSFKGLLRESLTNIAAWTGADSNVVSILLGEKDWTGTATGRRINVAPLTLDVKPEESSRCFGKRAFTSLENGTAMSGSLRECACVRKGLTFSGLIECAPEDEKLISLAVRNIKWIGSNRSRGFGSVRTICGESEKVEPAVKLTGTGSCIHYVLHCESPLIITDLSSSSGNSFSTRKFIPGSAVRGMVMEYLSSCCSDWFEQNLKMLLTDSCRFLPAYPLAGGQAAIPPIMGFYEDKNGGSFCSVLKDGNLIPGLKRAALGDFCTVRDGKIRCIKVETDDTTRIKIPSNCQSDMTGDSENKTTMFQTEQLAAGQRFEGYILLSSPDMADKISESFGGSVWLGADRYEGFGRCSVEKLELCSRPEYLNEYGIRASGETGTTLYMLAVTPFAMTDNTGDPCGLNTGVLASLLGCGSVNVELCSTSVSDYGSYNRKWQCRSRRVRMYDAGSIFKLECGTVPDAACVAAVEDSGIGLNTAEGYGRVLFMNAHMFESISSKEFDSEACDTSLESAAEIRRHKYEWIMNTAEKLKSSSNMPSASQLAGIQNVCDYGSDSALIKYMEKQLSERGPKHAARFRTIDGIIRNVLSSDLSATIGCKHCGPGTVSEKLELISMLINYDRRNTINDRFV